VKDDPTAEDPDEGWTIMLGGERDRGSWPRPTTYEGNVPPQPRPEEFPDQESFEESLGYWRSHFGRVQAIASRRSPKRQ
jgi:hypothetical protein